MHVHIFESSQLEGSYVGNFLYLVDLARGRHSASVCWINEPDLSCPYFLLGSSQWEKGTLGSSQWEKGTAKQTVLWHFLRIMEGFLGALKMLVWALKGKGLDTVHHNSLLCHSLFIIWFQLILTLDIDSMRYVLLSPFGKWINIELAKQFTQVFPYHHKVMKVLVTQVCLALCDPMDCSPPCSSVHGILQARILEWVAISFSRGSSQPRDWTGVSYNREDPVKVLVTQSCPTLCDPVDCSPPGSSVHGILQGSILEWVATSLSRGSSQPRD